MKTLFVAFLLFMTIQHAISATEPNKSLVALSGKLLLNVKSEVPTEKLETELAEIKKENLVAGLSNDNARKTFWINIYNAYFQILAVREKKKVPEIFTEKLIKIGQTLFSLDDIEHGILRKYRSKFSLGYLPQLFVSKTIKDLCVQEIDYRIHFTLNCGATSCPPIAFYEYDKLEKQLETATSSFLKSDVEIDTAAKTLKISRILFWFKADFGGEAGIKAIVSKYLKSNFADYSISYKKYDWNQKLKNYE